MVAPDREAAFEHLQLKDRVYHHLRAGIVDGSYVVGAALREVDVASRLGVSKTPVREAFVRLEKDRLVELIPYRGAVVAGYSAEDLQEISQVRQLIEGACAKSAAQYSTEADDAEMEANIAESVTALAAGDVATVVELFDTFDQLIYRHSHNKWIDDLIENLEGHQRRIGRLTVEIPGRMAKSLAQHQQIHDAIKSRDGAKAERQMRAHVASVMSDQLKSFTESQ